MIPLTQLPIPEDIPHPLLRDLIEGCTRRDPKLRPSFEKILDFANDNQDQIKRDGRLFADLVELIQNQNLETFLK